MSGVVPQLILVVVLVLLNAAFSGTEMALVSLREGQLQRLERKSATGAVLAGLARQPNQFLATIQIGITLAGFLASAAAAVSLAQPLEGPLGFLGGAAGPASVVVVTLILSYLTLVFGELAPKRVAMQRAERWAMIMARPLAFLSRLTRPAVWLLSTSTDVAVRLLGADPSKQRTDVTEEELRDMVAAHVSFTPEQRRIMDGAFEVAERTLEEILVPRGDVFVIDANIAVADALRLLIDSGFSRAPVAPDRALDDVVGFVHLRDLLANDKSTSVASITREVLIFPATARVLMTMRHLQTRGTALAIIVDEHGSVEGIVTLEDLIEEVVGEIYDEDDKDVALVQHLDNGVLIAPGRFPMHDLSDIGVDLPSGDYTTLAGFVLAELGRIPTAPGDVVECDGWRVEVTGVLLRAITEVRLTPTR